MICQHRDNEHCAIVAKLAGIDRVATVTDAACEFCTTRAKPPRARNKVTCDLAIAALRLAGRQADAEALLHNSPDIYAPAMDSAERLRSIEAGTGVGSQLWKLLSSLGIVHTATCSCLSLAEEMNRLGPNGCRRERSRLVDVMRRNAKSYGWGTVATAAARAVTTGLVWRLKLTDVYASLMDEAIRRAEAAKPIDILIPVGRGSRHNDVELRYALRSIARHARGVRRVWIVGTIPPWLHETDQVRLVPRAEIVSNKASRISGKIEWACATLDLTDQFAFWNDDYLLTKDIDIRTIPDWYHGDLFRGEDSEGWQALLNHTGEALRAAGLPAKHYDIHVPMLIDRRNFISLGAWWQRSRDDCSGYTMKSIYGNFYCQSTATPYPDAKLAGQWPERIDQLCADRPVISYGNEALRSGLIDWMSRCYPEPHPAEQTVVAVLGTFRGGTSCVAGVLHALGVDMGTGWRPRKTNPRGTFEDAALGRLCRRAFQEPGLIERMPPGRRIGRLRRWLRRRTAGVSTLVIGAKHPSLCLCVPQLLAAWPAVRLIAVDRPAEESVASIAKAMRSWTPEQAEANTRRMIETRDRDIMASGHSVHHIAYHDLLRDPTQEITRLIEFLDLDIDETTKEKAVATIDPALRTVAAA